MVDYRRNFVPGGTYFFTAALFDRNARLLTDYVGELRNAFRKARQTLPFRIDAIVVLPEHLHTIWTLPPGDADYPARWKRIKSVFTHGLHGQGVAVRKRRDGSALIWQRRYWEHTIRDEADLRRHIDYIHFNPVKHGWVARAADWPYSSFHWYVRQRMLSVNWAEERLFEPDFGEPSFGE